MPPKPKKTKEEIEAERLAEEAERAKQEAIDRKKQAELEEKRRLEEIRVAAERKALRAAELARLRDEHVAYMDVLKEVQAQRAAEDALEVCMVPHTGTGQRRVAVGKLP